MPDIPGLDTNFRGTVMHSSAYRDPADFKGQRVAVVGAGPSGIDLAIDIGSHATDVVLCLRDGRDVVSGMPCAQRVAAEFLDDGSTLRFADGLSCEVDAVVLATGYRYHYPWLENAPLDTSANFVMPLYLQLFHARWPSLAFVGVPQRINPMPIFEAQCDLVAALYSGRVAALPDATPEARVAAATAHKVAKEAAGMAGSAGHTLGAEQWDYMRHLDAIVDRSAGAGADAGVTKGFRAVVHDRVTDGSDAVASRLGAVRAGSSEQRKLRRGMYAVASALYLDVSASRVDPVRYKEREYRLRDQVEPPDLATGSATSSGGDVLWDVAAATAAFVETGFDVSDAVVEAHQGWAVALSRRVT